MIELFSLPLGNYYGVLEVGKDKEGKCYFLLDDYSVTDKLEISDKLYNTILEEFSLKEN